MVLYMIDTVQSSIYLNNNKHYKHYTDIYINFIIELRTILPSFNFTDK